MLQTKSTKILNELIVKAIEEGLAREAEKEEITDLLKYAPGDCLIEKLFSVKLRIAVPRQHTHPLKPAAQEWLDESITQHIDPIEQYADEYRLMVEDDRGAYWLTANNRNTIYRYLRSKKVRLQSKVNHLVVVDNEALMNKLTSGKKSQSGYTVEVDIVTPETDDLESWMKEQTLLPELLSPPDWTEVMVGPVEEPEPTAEELEEIVQEAEEILADTTQTRDQIINSVMGITT